MREEERKKKSLTNKQTKEILKSKENSLTNKQTKIVGKWRKTGAFFQVSWNRYHIVRIRGDWRKICQLNKQTNKQTNKIKNDLEKIRKSMRSHFGSYSSEKIEESWVLQEKACGQLNKQTNLKIGKTTPRLKSPRRKKLKSWVSLKTEHFWGFLLLLLIFLSSWKKPLVKIAILIFTLQI